MTIRVTQQYVDVFGPVSGKLRVSRQYVEVLHSAGSAVLTGDAASTLSFTQIACGLIEYQDASSTLGISDQAVATRTRLISASSALGLTDAVLKAIPAAASSTIIFTSSEGHFNYVDDRKVGESNLGLIHSATVRGFNVVDSDLGLSDSVDVRGPIPVDTHTYVWFTDSPRSLNKYLAVVNNFLVQDLARIPIPLIIEHTLGLTDLTDMSFIIDVFNVAQIVEVGKWPGVQHQVIPFLHVAIQNGTFRRLITDNLGIGHSLTYLDDTPCNRKRYTPFMGDNTVPNSNEAPLSEMPNPQYTGADRFLLYYPSRGVRTTSVNIRAPVFGDRDRNAYNRINRESRGGYLTVYADPIWPKIRTLVLTFTGLKKTDVDDIQSLFYAHLGQLIGITDWYGREWEGIITDPNQPAIQDGRNAWTVTFTFEGEVIVGHSPGNRIEAVDTQTLAKDPGANSALILAQELGGAESGIDKESDINFQQTAAGVVV